MLSENGFYETATKKAHSPPATNRFVMKSFQQDGVVIDRSTGLMWQQTVSPEGMIYSMAMDWVKDLNRRAFAGFKDWRLPTLEEGMTLLERSPNSGGLFIDAVFTSRKRLWMWTSERKDAESAWYVNFNYGYSQLNRVKYGSNCVRAVR
jgi:serine/threonine-protein kinase